MCCVCIVCVCVWDVCVCLSGGGVEYVHMSAMPALQKPGEAIGSFGAGVTGSCKHWELNSSPLE